MPGPVFFNTSSACLRQPDERCRPACTNRLPAYTVRLVRLCSRHRLFTELALDTHTRCGLDVRARAMSRAALGVVVLFGAGAFAVEKVDGSGLSASEERKVPTLSVCQRV